MLRRILNVQDGLAIVVGAVIGVGILRTPGLIAGYLGSPVPILLTWLLGGVVALLASLVFAELAAMFPEAGGKFYYANEAFGPTAGFVTGWAEIIVTRGFSAASKAIVIGEYLILLTGWGQVRAWAAGTVGVFLIINLLGLQTGRWFQNTVTLIKVGLILLIVGAGFFGNGSDTETARAAVAGGTGLLGFALAYLAVSFTYYGWDDFLKLAGEVKEPGHTLPRVLILGAIAVAVLYLLVNLAFLSALSPAEVAGSPLVAADVAESAFGEPGRRLITVAALVILVSSLNVQFMGLPRVVYGLSRTGLAPMSFSRLTPGGTPIVGLLVVTGIIFVMAMTRSFERLIQYLAFVAITVDTMVLLAVFRLRRTHGQTTRPFATPGYPWLPIITVSLYVTLFGIIATQQTELAIGGAFMVILLALIAHFWGNYWADPEAVPGEGPANHETPERDR
jgi:APA family basic amino acid/polyamine antiporter